MQYRSEVDGLRAIAVLAVVLYHLGLSWIPGGFVGVDVFFVISGFLITGNIFEGIQRGDFSLRRFYIARIRRIFPALIVTVGAAFGLAAIVFSPPLLVETAWSSIASIASVSNILFFTQSGYFDTEAIYKVFLHTWSLGVEEQFYLVWPLALLGLLSLRNTTFKVLIAGLMMVGFVALSEWGARWWPEAAFFLTPFRVSEFAIGGCTYFLIKRSDGGSSAILTITGLILIAASVAVFDEETVFPGLMALIPVLGAACVIAGGRNPLSQALLSNRLMVGVGLLSYSIYLVHWPIIVFYNYLVDAKPFAAADMTVILVATLFCAMLLYLLVERPFRFGTRVFQRPGNRLTVGLSLVVALFVAVPSLHAGVSGGWLWRVDARIANFDPRYEQDETQRWVRGASSPAKRPFSDDGLRVLILGDSHSKDVFNALHMLEVDGFEFRRLELRPRCFKVIEAFQQRTQPQGARETECFDSISALFETSLLESADVVLFTANWPAGSLSDLGTFMSLVERHAPLLITSRRVGYANIPELLFSAGVDRGQAQALATIDPEWKNINEALADQATALGIEVFDLAPITCDDNVCPIYTDDLGPLYYDGHHWTLAGARHFGRLMVDNGLLQLLESSV